MSTILMKFPGQALVVAQIRPALVRAALGLNAEDATVAVYHAVDIIETYAYVDLPESGQAGLSVDLQSQSQILRDSLAEHYPCVDVISLKNTLDVAGHSAGKVAKWHYVVETDVRAQAEDDFNAWYVTEHLPGLAAVPGTIRARRYISAASPKHYAAYDLENLETFGSTPWLAVRASDWSSRVRPNFFNTKRTMFRDASAFL